MSVIATVVAYPVASAIVGSAVVGAGSSYLSSKEQKKGTEKGIASQEAMSKDNLQLQEKLATQERADLAPWRDAGERALTQIDQGIKSGDYTMDNFDFTADPGYQFRMGQGIEARDASAAARGRLLSGAQNRALTEYGQKFASNEYANAYAREEANRTRKYNILSNLNTGGQNAAAGQANTTANLAATSGNIVSNLGQSQNVAAQNIGAARAGAYRDTAQSLNQGAQNWLLYKTLGK